jgi:hypothetical protein
VAPTPAPAPTGDYVPGHAEKASTRATTQAAAALREIPELREIATDIMRLIERLDPWVRRVDAPELAKQVHADMDRLVAHANALALALAAKRNSRR